MKAVILTAGRGSRFSPVSEYVPKEMLPIGSQPILGAVIKEAYKSVDDVIVVTNPKKKPIIEYIKNHWKGDVKLVYQRKPKGHTNAICKARKYIQYQDFEVMLGDTILLDKRASWKLHDAHTHNEVNTVVGISEQKKDTNKYGVVEGKWNNTYYEIDNIKEKPHKAKTNLVLNGRYILNYRHLRMMMNNPDLHLTEVINHYNRKLIPVLGVKLDNFFDVGTPDRYYEALSFYNKMRYKI